jgi:hypothetical protein
MYFNLLRTLLSLRKRHPYPVYSMTYHGDYGFDDFLKQGCKSDEELLQFITQRLTGKQIKLDAPGQGTACTCFAAKGAGGGVLYGRNYDFPDCPSIVVKTRPKNGYASVAVSDMTPLGYTRQKPPRGIGGKLPLMALPYMPFDGMNEKGLAVSILQVFKTKLPDDPAKITLNTTTMVRLLLDKAATVDEAVAFFHAYNVYFSGEIYCHYLITERSGKSVIVEYWDGAMHVVEETIASNFMAHNGYQDDEPCAHPRYQKVKATLDALGDCLDMDEAAKLLCDVAYITRSGHCILQWSSVYDLERLTGMVFPHRDASRPYRFKI